MCTRAGLGRRRRVKIGLRLAGSHYNNSARERERERERERAVSLRERARLASASSVSAGHSGCRHARATITPNPLANPPSPLIRVYVYVPTSRSVQHRVIFRRVDWPRGGSKSAIVRLKEEQRVAREIQSARIRL